jgi:hypothetical protein
MHHPLFDAPTKPPPARPQPPLPSADVITVFDESSVDANYEGKLALHQIDHLRKSVFNTSVAVSAAFIVTLFLGLTAWSSERVLGSILAVAVLLMICSALCFPMIRRIFNLRREIKGQVVFHVDGRIHLLKEIKKTRRGSIQNHAIVMNGTTFYVPESAFAVCRRDIPYRLYFTPIRREFMNVHSLLLPQPADLLSESIRNIFNSN